MNPLLIAPLTELVGSVINRIWPDPAQQAEAQLRLAKMAQDGELARMAADTQLATAQIKVNEVEAGSESLFKSGWRPSIGWTCSGGLFYQLMARPLAGWVMENLYHWSPPPSLEMDTLLTLLFGMLGLGAYRTYEKVKAK